MSLLNITIVFRDKAVAHLWPVCLYYRLQQPQLIALCMCNGAHIHVTCRRTWIHRTRSFQGMYPPRCTREHYVAICSSTEAAGWIHDTPQGNAKRSLNANQLMRKCEIFAGSVMQVQAASAGARVTQVHGLHSNSILPQQFELIALLHARWNRDCKGTKEAVRDPYPLPL
jgi:hypothetical protein